MVLMLFVFSITPKKYLHDLVANHTDFYSTYAGSETAVHKAGINCDCEDLVVSTPFVEAGIEEFNGQPKVCSSLLTPHHPFHYPTQYATKDSRGPPALA